MWEYFCKACKQLRAYAASSSKKPTRCGACSSGDIEVDELGSERLARLRFGDREPDAKYTLIVPVPEKTQR